MDVRALRYFVAVAEEGSVHAGARRVMVAQPALSQAIRRLEREVGGPLFRRSHRGVELTEAGDSLLEHARYIIGYLDDATDKVREKAQASKPVVHVGLVEGRMAAAELTGSIVAAFQRDNPGIRVQLHELSMLGQYEAVLDGVVDVALVRLPYVHDDLDAVPLFTEPLVLALSAEHPLARLETIDLERVLDQPMIQLTRTPKAWRDFWHLTPLRGERSRAVPTTGVTLLEVQFDLMTSGGLAAAASSAWRMVLRDAALCGIPIPDAPRNTAGVGFRRDNLRPEVQAFVAAARRVTRAMIDLVPDGELIPDGDNNLR